MKKYLVLQITRFLNGDYATKVVAEYTDREKAHEYMSYRNQMKPSDFFLYKTMCITFPKF